MTVISQNQNVFARNQVPRSRATNEAYLLLDMQEQQIHGSEEIAHVCDSLASSAKLQSVVFFSFSK